MEQFIVSARKYRPQTFKDVVGQQAITSTLVNAIESNHLAQALLFTGPRGVGKTTCARILARKINQEGYDDPNEDFAFNVFELDAASNNSVDDIRSLIDQVRIPPQTGKYKVYIIDEVHMLSSAAFNAFLKTLEEPPRHAIFILATTEKHKIIPTILSRCQIFDFKRITIADAANHLADVARSQGINFEDDALRIIAQKADGAMRDALSIFDRVVSYCGRNLTRQAVAENLNVLDFEYYIRITDMVLQGNIPGLLLAYNDILSKGFDGHHFVSGLASHFRDLMVCKTPETINLLEIGDHGKQLFYNQSQQTSMPFLLQAIEIANDCDLKYKSSQNQRLLVELCLMQLASLSFEGEKKKDKQFIIPASVLRDLLTSGQFSNNTVLSGLSQVGNNHTQVDSQELSILQQTNTQASAVENSIMPSQSTFAQVENEQYNAPVTSIPSNEVSQAPLNSVTTPANNVTGNETSGNEVSQPKRASALSLTSIRNRKELASSLEKNVINPDDLPKEPFTYDQLIGEWNYYMDRLLRGGLPLMASLMNMARPTLKGFQIELELPNAGSKLSFEENKYDLVNYLRKKLQNFDIELTIIVNEEIKLVKRVLDSKDKYQHFVNINPEVEKLRDIFDLELK